MTRKRLYIIVAVSVLAITTTVSAYAFDKDISKVKDADKPKCTTSYAKDQFSRLANISKKYNVKVNGAVKINNTIITKEQIEERKELLLEMNNSDVSYDVVIKQLALQSLLLDDAKNKNIIISFNDAQKESLKEREIFSDPNKTPEDQKIAIQEYIKALGISEDEYWNNYHAKETQKFMTVEALNKLILQKAQDEGKIKDIYSLDPKEAELKKNYLDSYEQDLFKNAEKQIINNDLKNKLNIIK